MILVDIYVPAVDKTYNFSLNENVEISSVVAEITEMIEQKERTRYQGEGTPLHLYHTATKSMLPDANTLMDCYVTSGSRLILI